MRTERYSERDNCKGGFFFLRGGCLTSATLCFALSPTRSRFKNRNGGVIPLCPTDAVNRNVLHFQVMCEGAEKQHNRYCAIVCYENIHGKREEEEARGRKEREEKHSSFDFITQWIHE